MSRHFGLRKKQAEHRIDFMAIKWPHLLAEWITPELALHNWRERIAQVETQESIYFGNLPYVKAVAVIGSVGRGEHWPISDVDMFIAADLWQRKDPEILVRSVERERNKQLHAAGIPNDVEAGNWVLLSREVAAAANADDDAFFEMLNHPHWLGIAIKSGGARVVRDFDGCVTQFLSRCGRVLFGDRFVRLWLQIVIEDVAGRLVAARSFLKKGDSQSASAGILVAAQHISGGIYGRWRRLPQSISRGVTRFLAAASIEGDMELGEMFLQAVCLSEEDVWRRFAAVPPAGQRERDVWLAIRRANGENIDELAATRDLLQISSYLAMRNGIHGPYPEWTGVTGDKAAVRTQLVVAEQLLERLRSEIRGLTIVSDSPK